MQFESGEARKTSREEPPAWMTRIFYCLPYSYFDNPMTGFVNRINTANQSVDHNKKLPANLADDTVKSVKTKLSDAVFARW